MGKLILNTNNQEVSVKLSTNNPNFTMTGNIVINMLPANIPTCAGINGIEVNNNSKLNIVENELPLNNIDINAGSLNINNSYEGETLTNILIKANGKFIQTGKDLPINEVILEPQANFVFTHQGSNYQLSNPHVATSGNNITFKDLHSLIEIVKAVEKIFVNNENPIVDPKQTDLFKKYEKVINENKEIVELLIEQNELSCDLDNIDSYIRTNYFEIAGIAHSLDGSNLSILPNEMISEIKSYLSLTGEVEHNSL